MSAGYNIPRGQRTGILSHVSPWTSNPVLPMFLVIGVVFGALAALSAYLIAYHEYRQRMLRLDQNPVRMAVQTAASVVLAFVLKPTGS